MEIGIIGLKSPNCCKYVNKIYLFLICVLVLPVSLGNTAIKNWALKITYNQNPQINFKIFMAILCIIK